MDDQTASVANHLQLGVVEAGDHRGGRCVADRGYELGETGAEEGTAQRLAYLLGLPQRCTCRRT
ncbi:hypothetical protein [Streptomyces sp. Je 1-369]|uniref:hypothetical protein n=1 Tax=Streptomyces sp. Je 1-369 TaxID=2966192 RepID=UPI002285D066|nr:hypothetical protein [Streptomyces sp. Je 1-369]WAL96091.1 hypothetical protein NOO62_17305 [Streptomyces sp. Je 1-369]